MRRSGPVSMIKLSPCLSWMYRLERNLLFLGSEERQTEQEHPGIGIPVLVPEPKKVRIFFFFSVFFLFKYSKNTFF